MKNHQKPSKFTKIDDFQSQIWLKKSVFPGSGKKIFFLFWNQKFELGQSLDEDISKLRWSRIKNWVSRHAYATRTLTWTSFYHDPRNHFARKNKKSFFPNVEYRVTTILEALLREKLAPDFWGIGAAVKEFASLC